MELPQIFDRQAQRRFLDRAIRSGFETFLVDRAAGELIDRLSTVKRRFERALDLGTPSPSVFSALQSSEAVGTVIRAAPSIAAARPGDIVTDEEYLPFAPASFDLVASVMSLQNINDLPGTLAQVRRVLRPDGLFLAAFAGGNTLTELRQSLATAESECEEGVSPRVSPFADLRDLGGLLQRAGFALPVADVDTVTVRYGNPLSLMQDLRAMGLSNALQERRKQPLRRTTLMRACAFYLERFAAPDGRMPATFDILWLSGWAPHESQQKPLKPGSAKMRLADVLGDRSSPGTDP